MLHYMEEMKVCAHKTSRRNRIATQHIAVSLIPLLHLLLTFTFLAIDSSWAFWGSWGACSETCGPAVSPNRWVDLSLPRLGVGNGLVMLLSTTAAWRCVQEVGGRRRSVPARAVSSPTLRPVCPGQVGGEWASWGSWGSCTASCATGIQSRSRECAYRDPACRGDPCTGSTQESRLCNTNECRKSLLTTCCLLSSILVLDCKKNGLKYPFVNNVCFMKLNCFLPTNFSKWDTKLH